MRVTLKTSAFATLTLFAVLTAGCNSDTGHDGTTMDPPTGSGPSTNPGGTPFNPPNPDGPGLPPTPAPVKANYSGVYEVVAPIDFTKNGVLPNAVGGALGGLAELHDHPGDALLKIVTNAGIPYLSDILQQVPSFLMKALASLLDDLIIDNLYNGYPVVDEVANIIQGIFELTKKLEIHDTLTVHKMAADGSAAIDQQLSAVGFTLLGQKSVATFAGAKKVSMNGKITPHPNAPVADADLQLDLAMFQLPIGDLLLQAAGPLLFGQFGGATTLKGALTNLVPCSTVAQDISSGLGGIISANQAETLCVGALGLIADQVENAIKAITFDGVKVDAGLGKLYDVSQLKPSMDNQSDRVAEGKWNWTFDVSGSKATVPSTFSGERTGDAN
jgi:hypothetical protein